MMCILFGIGVGVVLFFSFLSAIAKERFWSLVFRWIAVSLGAIPTFFIALAIWVNFGALLSILSCVLCLLFLYHIQTLMRVALSAMGEMTMSKMFLCAFAGGGFIVFGVVAGMNAPMLEDPFNMNGRHISGNYYLYKFSEGEEPNNYYLWRKYDELPSLPFCQNVSLIILVGDAHLYVCIDHQWYLVNMKTDEISKIGSPPCTANSEKHSPQYFWNSGGE